MHALPLPFFGGICTRLPIRIASYWPSGRPEQDHIVYVPVGEPGGSHCGQRQCQVLWRCAVAGLPVR